MIAPILSLVFFLIIALIAMPAQPCSRFLWNNNNLGVFVARTMDWPESTEPIITVFPRGMIRDGGKLGTEVVIAENPAQWISQYGSMVTTMYGLGAIDGFNEKGLGIHMLYLDSTDFGPRNSKQPGVHAGLWGQYLLDTSATVTEALENFKNIQVVMAEARGHKAALHLVMEDAHGDSAVIEYIGGKPVIYHSRQYRIMTDEPSYDQQIELLQQLDFSHFSNDTPLPGNVKSTDRFQRIAYYSALLSEPKNEREAVASVLAITRNVSVPFGVPYRNFGIPYNTEYRTIMNLTQRRYYFELATSLSVIWADLLDFDLSPGAPVKILNPDNMDLSGNVAGQFRSISDGINRDTARRIAEIYVATLGYAPDSEGFYYWLNEVNSGKGWTPLTVAQSFFDQPLVQEKYPLGQEKLLINALYQNIFGRAPSAEEQRRWLDELQSGRIRRHQMIIALIENGWADFNAPATMARFDNQTEVALAFVAAQTTRGIVYSRLTPYAQSALLRLGRESIMSVTADPSTRDAVIAALPTQISNY